jgi:putative ABC transport system permease protein
MLAHYLRSAWGNFLRSKVTTLLSVVGLAIGLTCFIVASGALSYIRSADRSLPNPDRVVMIWQRYADSTLGIGGVLTPFTSPALVPVLRRELPSLTAIAQIYGSSSRPVAAADHRLNAAFSAADADYLKIIDLPRSQSGIGNPLEQPNGAILSSDIARRLFGDANPLGQVIRVDGKVDLYVAAVLKPIASPSHLAGPDSLGSLGDILISRDTEAFIQQALNGQRAPEQSLTDQWYLRLGSAMYALLPADHTVNIGDLRKQLVGIDRRNNSPPHVRNEFEVVPLREAWLYTIDMSMFSGSVVLSLETLLRILALTVLAVSCASYTMLAVSQARVRAKEIGLRRSVGATKAQLVQQALVETGLHVFIAFAVAMFVALEVGTAIDAATGLSATRALLLGPEFWMQIFATLALTVIFTSFFPALLMANTLPAQCLRKSRSTVATGSASKSLMVLQFAIAVSMMTLFAVVYAQDLHTRHTAVYDETDPLVFLGAGYLSGGAGEDVWRNELLRSGAVKSVSVTNVAPWQLTPGFFPLKMSNEAVLAPFPVNVGYGFDKSLGLRFLAGRTFTAAMGDEDRVSGPQPTVIVDQTLARALGYPEARDAIGKTIQRGAHSSGEPPVTIVGVVEDRPYLLQPFDKFTGHVYVPDPKSTWCLLVTLDHSRVREGLEVIDTTWKHLSPAAPVDRQFATDAFERAYRFYRLFEQILLAIDCGVTLVTLLGVAGFASLILYARSAEIGLRRVLGASAIGILGLLMRGFAMPLLVACLVAWPIAFTAARRYLQTFLQPIALSALPFILSLVALTAIVGIVGYVATSRAFRVQLAAAVKHE